MNLRVPWNAGNFLTSSKPVSFSRRTLHHGVSKFGYYCTFTQCGETCVVLPLKGFRFAQYISDWRSEMAIFYSLYFQLGCCVTYIWEFIIYFIYSNSRCLLLNCHGTLLTCSTVHVTHYCGISILTCLNKAFYWHIILQTHNTEITYYWHTIFITAFYWHTTDVHYSHTTQLTYSTGISYYWCTMVLIYSNTAEILHYMCTTLLIYHTTFLQTQHTTDILNQWHAVFQAYLLYYASIVL